MVVQGTGVLGPSTTNAHEHADTVKEHGYVYVTILPLHLGVRRVSDSLFLLWSVYMPTVSHHISDFSKNTSSVKLTPISYNALLAI